MAITGNFTDFSLPELFLFLEQGHKSGLLYIGFLPENNKHCPTQVNYFWLYQGRVVAAADRLDQQGLTLMISQRGWISERVISRVVQICPNNTPMGLCLKSQGLLQPEQLKLLFNTQVVRQVSTLLEIKDGLFTFDPTAILPTAEMTGISMSATEVTLTSLRSLRNWSALTDKLPDPTSGLSCAVGKQPDVPLNAQESQVWEFVNGNIPLKKIATNLKIPVETVQQIAFRLIVIGLAEEQFMVASPSGFAAEELIPATSLPELAPVASSQEPVVSQSFLKNLVGFLRGNTKSA
jgi:hypothetical protein